MGINFSPATGLIGSKIANNQRLPPNQDQIELFRNRSTSIISLDNELCRLEEQIDWAWIYTELDGY